MSKAIDSTRSRCGRPSLDGKLAAYLASAGAVGLAAANEADGAIVANTTPQAIGINGEVSIDFNGDTQIDFQVDHDRVTLPGGGPTLDYLQIDKNDLNGEANPLPFPPEFETVTFPINSSPKANDEAGIVSFFNPDASVNGLGGYAVALKPGDPIGPSATLNEGAAWDFQEQESINLTGKATRANRLIDEDATQIDMVLGGKTAEQVYLPYRPDPPSATLDDWYGLGGATRYVGVKVDFANASESAGENYGWIGIRIDNEADATGVVTGWAYETVKDTPILAGDTGPAAPGDYNRNGKVDGEDFLVWQQQFGSTVAAGTGADGNNDTLVNTLDLGIWKGAFGTATGAGAAVPEPASLMSALVGGGLICCAWLRKRLRGRAQA